MAISREIVRQIEILVRPIATRVANTVARAVVRNVNDSTMMQLLQIEVLKGELVEGGRGAEHFQPYGISGVPPIGSEGIVMFPNGDRGHPLVFGVTHRASRPASREAGELTIYNGLTGAKVVFTKDGDIVVSAAPGRDVLIDDGSGATEPVVKRSEFLSHGHVIVATGAVSPCAGPVAGALPAGSAATFPGTDTLKVK